MEYGFFNPVINFCWYGFRWNKHSFGAMFGGFIIGILVQLSVGLEFMDGHTEAKNAIALALMIIILLVRPQGIFGSKDRIS